MAEIDAVLAASPAVGAWHAGKLVGFARAVIDTNLRAYLEDVVVDRAHRRRGVATAILERLLSELGTTHLVSLFSSAELAPFYRRLGFRPTRQVVMHLHTREPGSTARVYCLGRAANGFFMITPAKFIPSCRSSE